MKDSLLIITLSLSLLFATTGFAAKDFPSGKPEAKIKANQVAYYIGYPKKAVVADAGGKEFFLIDAASGKKVFTGRLTPGKYWEQSGETVAIADFSAFNIPGNYIVMVNDSLRSYPFAITDQPQSEITKASAKAFYYNRSGFELTTKYAGKWARKAGHPDTEVFVHESAATAGRPEGFKPSSPKGWYDAGDYNKYIVNSAITTSTLLEAYHRNKEFYNQLNLDIPESGNNMPDLLDEALYNLRWMITMQDPHDGGVYHKLTTKQFEGFIMPDQGKELRYVVQKNSAATLDFAATMAQSARIFKAFEKELPGWSDSCLVAAQYAWEWAMTNPDLRYTQPKDIGTGGYGDRDLSDEWLWAACELFLATGDEKYKEKINIQADKVKVPDWGGVYTMGIISLLNHPAQLEKIPTGKVAREAFLQLADSLVKNQQESPYNTSIARFRWGSNSDVANFGMIKLIAYQQTREQKYLHSAMTDLDYILGCNATGFCFVTGSGSHSSMKIHHRPSAADGIDEPVPGFLAGGPNLSVMTDCSSSIPRSKYPAASYLDEECSYSTNEIAINWNAPLVFLSGGIDASLIQNSKK